MHARRLLASTMICLAAAPGVAHAFVKNPQADAAMRKGIRDNARVFVQDVHGHHPKVSRIHVRCVPVPHVNDRKPCTGSFRLTLHGRSADYTLKRSSTFRISRGAIEYHLYAEAVKVKNLPSRTGCAGFLQ